MARDLSSLIGRVVGRLRGRAALELSDPRIVDVMRGVSREGLTYLGEDALRDLARVAQNNEKERREGMIVETGCASGGSAIVLAASKSPAREMRVYDVFGMIPAPSERDSEDVHQRYEVIASGKSEGLKGQRYYGYESDLYGKVVEAFRSFDLDVGQNNVHLIKGLYQDTLTMDGPVALAHIDCDWYDSVMVCLERIEPRVVPGGTIVIDDYFHWSGCRKAVDDYFQARPRSDYQFVPRSRLHIVKQREKGPGQ